MAVNYCNQEIKGTLTTTGTITSGGSITMPDYIYHTGDTNTYFGFNGSDDFRIYAGNTLKMIADGTRVRLYYNGSEKFSTTSTGIEITGGLTTSASSSIAGANVTADFAWSDSIKATFGASNDLQIYHDGSNSYIAESGTGRLIISGGSDVQIQSPSGELMADFNGNSSVDLYYDNSKKFETITNGIKLTNTEGTQIHFVESDSTYTESMRIIRYQDVLGFHYGDNASEEAFTIDNTGEATAHKNLTVSGGNITLSGTGRIQGIDTVSSGTDAANKTYVDNAVSGAGSGTFLPLAGGTMTGPLVIQDSVTNPDPLLTLYNSTNGNGSTVLFSDQTGSSQKGRMTFFHSDGSSQGGGASFQFYSTEADMTLQVGASGNAARVVVWSANNQSEVGYGFADDVNTGMTRLGVDQVGLIAGAVQGVYVSTTAVQLKNAGNTKLATSSTGVSVTGNMVASGDVYAEDNIYLTDAGTARAAISLDSSDRDNLNIKAISLGSIMRFYTVDTLALTLDASQNATFASGLTMPNYINHTGNTTTRFGFATTDTFHIDTNGSLRFDVNNNGMKLGNSNARVTTILDEDNMASDSATALATQQSIKAYVDSSTTGVLTYQGTWNADTNSPTLSSGSGTPGYYYIVSTAGTTDLDGITDWQVGDWAVFSDQATDAWQKIDNTAVGNVSGSGSNNRLVLWSGTSTVDSDSNFYMSGTTLYAPNLSNTTGDLSISSAGATTIDSTGDITIDAGGGDIILSDDGVVTGTFSLNNEHLDIRSRVSNKDINFKGSDAGSEITALTLDMSDAGAAIFNQALYIPHYIYHTGDTNTYFGFSNDDTWRITTGGSTAITVYNNSIVTTGDFTVGDELTITTIGNATADPDKFLCASGANKVGYRTGAQVLSDIGAASSSSLGSYLPLAGGTMTGDLQLQDNVRIDIGNSSDLQLWHNGSNSYVFNYNTGALNIGNSVTDGNTNFLGDDGSGGEETYFRVDGGDENVQYAKNLLLYDNVELLLGTSGDFQAYHNGSTTYLRNNTGTLEIRNQTSGASDIIFKTTTSAPSLDTFITLDGSADNISIAKNTIHPDSVYTYWGDSNDFYIGHTSTNTVMLNSTGNLEIGNYANDKDILLRCDDGSGGIATYFLLDGSIASGGNLFTRFPDNSRAVFGTGSDLQIFHDGTNSEVSNLTGNLNIKSTVTDGDISFYADNGSGGTTEYFRLDGSGQYLLVSAALGMYFNDGIAARFGNSGDLIAYHDGSNSYITNATGDLYIQGNGDDVVIQGADDVQIKVQGGEVAANFGGNGGVDLYHNNSVKFNTTSNGIEVTGKTDTDTLLIGTSTEVDAILDEDNMASNSATSLATQQSIKAYVDAISVPTVNNSTITLTAGTGLTGSSSFTLNQASNQTITFSLSVNSLSTSTTAGDADFFIVGTTMGAEYKMAPANIALSHFNNDSGWTTNAGTVTSVSVGTGLDISNSTTTPSITMDLTELTLGSGLDATATGLSLDFSEFVSATADEVTSFIVYNSGDTQPERLLVSNVHDIDAYWKYTPVIFNGSFNDGTSSTSTFYIPIAGSTSETTSSQEYQFAAMPFAGRVRTLMMQNTGTTPTTTNSTRFKIYKNGSLAYTSSYQVPTNGGSVGAYIKFDNINETFSIGDRIQFAYNKQFTSDYWRDVAFTAVVEFQQM